MMLTRPNRRERRDAGIGLFEVAVVLMILSCIAGIAIPKGYTMMRSYKLNLASMALSQQFNLARQEAVRVNRPTKVRVTGTSVRFDNNHDGSVTGQDGDATVISYDPTLNVSNSTISSATDGQGYVTYSSRGEIRLGDNPAVFTLSLYGKRRDVRVDIRGVVTVGNEY